MSENTSSYAILPWKIPQSIQNFVPKYSRFFIYNKYSVFLTWRWDVVLIFTLHYKTESLSSQKPLQSQVILSKEPILDILLIDNCMYFISPKGLFQVLCSKERAHFGEVLNHLGDCKTFSLSDAFELPTSKSILAVASMQDSRCVSSQSYFAVITCAKDDSRVGAELYLVSQKDTRAECQLQYASIIHSSLQNIDTCTCSFLSYNQARSLFNDCKDAEVLLVALQSGQLFYIPYLISTRNFGIKPTARLIYQSHWCINGMMCPTDGSSIFLFLEGGTVVNISPLPNKSGESTRTSLSYNSFSLSYPMRSFSAPRCDLLVISDNMNTSVIQVVSSDQTLTNTIAIKGVTTLSSVPEEDLVIASTFHNVFYLFNSSNSIQSIRDTSSNHPWAGCDLDVSLQLVQDMRVQTKLLSKFRKELDEENSLVKALSAVARAPILAEFFKLTIKVLDTHDEHYAKKKTDFSMTENAEKKFAVSIEIRNNSPEDFSSSLWNMCLQIKSSDGLATTKNVPLLENFNHEFPFCITLNVPFPIKKNSLPIQVKADLIAEIKDAGMRSEWLKICLGVASLDISYFFSVSSQTPQTATRNSCDISVFLNQMQRPCEAPDLAKQKLQENAMMTSYSITIPKKFREPKLIIDHIFANCQQHHSLATKTDFYNQSDRTVILLKFLQNTVQLVFRKSCASITISGTDLNFLHSIKLHIVSLFGANHESSLIDAEDDASCHAALSKAKNLSAVLETVSLNKVLDGKQLIAIYQDLRNNVSSHIHSMNV